MPDNKDKFRVVLTEHAIADLEDIPIESQDQIHSGLKSLESNPFPHTGSTKRLKGFRPPLYRLRLGNFRILYRIQENTVIVLRAIDRKLLDRILKRSGI